MRSFARLIRGNLIHASRSLPIFIYQNNVQRKRIVFQYVFIYTSGVSLCVYKDTTYTH